MAQNSLFSTFIFYHGFLHFHDILNTVISCKHFNEELWQYINELYVDAKYIPINHKLQKSSCIYKKICLHCKVKLLCIENAELSRVNELLCKPLNRFIMRNIFCSNNSSTRRDEIFEIQSNDNSTCINSIQNCMIDYYTGSFLQLNVFLACNFPKILNLELNNCFKLSHDVIEDMIRKIPTLERLAIENSLFLSSFDLSCCVNTNMKCIAIRYCPNFSSFKSCQCVKSMLSSEMMNINTARDVEVEVDYICSMCTSGNKLNVESLDLSYTSVSVKTVTSLLSNRHLRSSLRSLTCDHCLKMTGDLTIKHDHDPDFQYSNSSDNIINFSNSKLNLLSLVGCLGLTSIHLNLPSLMSLSLQGCFELKKLTVASPVISELDISLLLKLSYLIVENSMQLVDAVAVTQLKSVISSCEHLEVIYPKHLQLSCSTTYASKSATVNIDKTHDSSDVLR